MYQRTAPLLGNKKAFSTIFHGTGEEGNIFFIYRFRWFLLFRNLIHLLHMCLSIIASLRLKNHETSAMGEWITMTPNTFCSLPTFSLPDLTMSMSHGSGLSLGLSTFAIKYPWFEKPSLIYNDNNELAWKLLLSKRSIEGLLWRPKLLDSLTINSNVGSLTKN